MTEKSQVRFPAVPPPGATLGKLFTHVPLFTKQYKLVPASAGDKVHHHRSGVGYAGSHSADLAVGGQPAPLQHRSYLWLPLYSGLELK